MREVEKNNVLEFDHSTYSGMEVQMVVKRLSGFYIKKIMVTCLLINSMSWSIYWIDPAEVGSTIRFSFCTLSLCLFLSLSLSLFVTFSLPLFLSFSLSLSKYMFISCLLALCATFPHSHSTPPLPNTQTYIHTYAHMHTHDQVGDRIGVSTTLALTVIAFQFAVAEALPRVSYMTVMDWCDCTPTL